MPDAYEVGEAVFIQERTYTSAANDDIVTSDAVPAGKVWTILSASYYPSVAETQTVFFSVLSRVPVDYPVTFPRSVALSTSIKEPLLTDGLELKLFPHESLRGHRGAHTAGSTITIQLRFIESDLPLYTYTEPQARKRQAVSLSELRSRIGGTAGRPVGSLAGGVVAGGGGGRRSLPK